MTLLAVVLVALGACCYAAGARLQHGAVASMVGDGGFNLRRQLQLVQDTQWLSGLVALGTGALLHATALGMAPLSVVQPIGVLALPLTVLLNMRQRGMGIGELDRRAVFAVVACTGGVAVFVMLAVGSATATAVAQEDELLATQLVAAGVAVLGVFALMSRSKVRCVAYAAGCAVAYGYVSLLVRGAAQDFSSGGLVNLDLVPVTGIVAAMLVGGWLLQHAYASGPPDLVVACLTVIDPLVAVGLGIGLLGEADRVPAWVVVGESLCAAIACAGVFALARYHPETRSRAVHAAAVQNGSAVAGPSLTDRPDGSTP